MGHRISGPGRALDGILSIIETHYSCINEAQTLYPGIKGIRSRNNWLEAIPAKLSFEDHTILEAARRTSDVLGLTGFSPTAVSWEEVTNQGRKGAKVVTPHFPVFQGAKLIISPILQGRLVADDWGPILASSLVFYRKLKRRSTVGTFLRVLPALLVLTGFLVLPEALASPTPLIVGLVVAAVVLLILGVYSAIRLDRLLVLEADKEAAKVIGSASLIEALRKLEHLRELDAARGGEWPEYGDHPSITKRIASLQGP